MNAIQAAPTDDLARLVKDDWLEEHGHPELAELSRKQIELDRLLKENQVGSWFIGSKASLERAFQLDTLIRENLQHRSDQWLPVVPGSY